MELLSSSSGAAAGAKPPAPPPPPAAAAAAVQNGRDGALSEEGESCVICMAAPASAGFVHGESLHVCCCGSCAAGVRERGDACPLCREAVDRVVLRVYSTKG